LSTLKKTSVRPLRLLIHLFYYQKIDSTDRRINELVYELYGLTDEEIKIVEGAAEGK
jgi:type II restriction/modification system DNA methylase subunit YeeA